MIKKLIPILALLFFAMPSLAAISVVQTVTGYGGSTGGTVNITPTNGNAVVVYVSCYSLGGNVSLTSIQDNHGNNLAADSGGMLSPSGGLTVALGIYRLQSASGVTGITVTWGTPSNLWGMIISEVSGLASSPIDQADTVGTSYSSSGGSNTWTSTSLSTTNANDIVIGGVFTAAGTVTYTGTGSWTLAGTLTAFSSFAQGVTYQIVSSTSSYAPQGNSSMANNGDAISIAYKATGGGGTVRRRGAVIQ